jgi:tetratricopeptide (TPR) repeat protein
MINERLSQLLEKYKNEPENLFNIHSLAIEYEKYAPEKALAYYEELLKKYPDFLPPYSRIAKLYATMDEIDQAEKLIDIGIELANKQNDSSTLAELQDLLDDLIDY